MNRALLVGINKYPGQPLNGCVNDVQDMEQLRTRYNALATTPDKKPADNTAK